jgi:hypothetical protein
MAEFERSLIQERVKVIVNNIKSRDPARQPSPQSAANGWLGPDTRPTSTDPAEVFANGHSSSIADRGTSFRKG